MSPHQQPRAPSESSGEQRRGEGLDSTPVDLNEAPQRRARDGDGRGRGCCRLHPGELHRPWRGRTGAGWEEPTQGGPRLTSPVKERHRERRETPPHYSMAATELRNVSCRQHANKQPAEGAWGGRRVRRPSSSKKGRRPQAMEARAPGLDLRCAGGGRGRRGPRCPPLSSRPRSMLQAEAAAMEEGGGGRDGGGRRPPGAYLSPARGRLLLHAEAIDMAVLCRGVPLPHAAAPPDPLRRPPDSPTPPHARERDAPATTAKGGWGGGSEVGGEAEACKEKGRQIKKRERRG
jgi:hypothetical protein